MRGDDEERGVGICGNVERSKLKGKCEESRKEKERMGKANEEEGKLEEMRRKKATMKRREEKNRRRRVEI